MTPEEHAEVIGETARRYLGVIERSAQAAGVPCRCIHVIDEFPADAILRVAEKEKCDLIFMASHGHRGRSGLLLGSETQKVLTHSGIPVVVYRTPGAANPGGRTGDRSFVLR